MNERMNKWTVDRWINTKMYEYEWINEKNKLMNIKWINTKMYGYE